MSRLRLHRQQHLVGSPRPKGLRHGPARCVVLMATTWSGRCIATMDLGGGRGRLHSREGREYPWYVPSLQ